MKTTTTRPRIEEATFTVNSKWQITSFSEHAEELMDLVAEKMIGKNCQEAFSTTGRFAALCSLYGPLSTGRAVNDLRMVLEKPDSGEKIVLLVSAIPFPDQDGILEGAVIVLRDESDPAMVHPLILDSIADGVFTVDRNMKITSFNQAAARMTGWEAQEVIGNSCKEVFKSDICGDGCILARSIETGKPIINQLVYITDKDGHTLPVTISASPLTDPSGKIIGGVETFRDVTGIIEKDLVLGSIADGVFSVDRNMKITSFNKAAEEITGWTRGESIGKQCKDIFHSSICGEKCILAHSLSDGDTVNNQTVFIERKDGKTIPISISASPLRGPSGEIIGGVETFKDVTGIMEKDLILESIADGVFTVDRNWQITSFNRAAELATGWTRKEAIGHYCSEVFHSSICGESCAIAQSLYSGKPISNRSIFIKNTKGEKVPVSISAAPLVDHEGNVIGGVETFRDLTLLDTLRKQLSQRFTFGEILSKSSSMQRIFNILPEIAASESNVLVLGESGTGKELIARATHNSSNRKNGPFIAVNCGALPENLLESELFGYKAGAFTDAKNDRQGRFAAASGGTLFLDEIGDIPAALQVKLLRVLQEKIYEPLGSNKPVKADVRIIAATNRDLKLLVQEGLFREDLFYRLNVVKIQLPPLRERMKDVPMLIEHFTKRYSAQQGKDIMGISDDALAVLMRYDFPGNIRELENIIEYSFILCHGGLIQSGHLPEPFTTTSEVEQTKNNIITNGPLTLEEVEKQAIFQALERNKWKRLATCRELKISKDTLRRKIAKFKLEENDAIE
jgi:PAS domain S-box-containing protein